MWETPLKSNFSQSADSSAGAIHQHSKFITVTCRLKPLFINEEKSNIEIDTKSHAITLNDPTKSISKTYAFDEIFDQNARQGHFTNRICEPLVRFLKNGGESGLIFSYGITNSGKTYTILGTKEQPGILLTLIKKLEEEFKQETLRIVACQLYKDEFFSLKTKGEKLHPKQLRGTFTFDECHSDVINENNMEELFSQYLTNRSCSSTSFNTISSRSHAIFKIMSKKFRIGVVDLAGSERTAKGHENGVDLKETIFINSSLLTLKKCIKSLEDKSQLSQKVCIPYRESKLTQSLVEYFVPNSKISIIVNINQARHCLQQNINAMDYTSKSKNITANVMSDFSKMLKSTARKKEEIIVAIKNYKIGKSNNKTNYVEVNKLTNSKIKTFTKSASSNTFSSKQKILKSQQNQPQYSNLTEELYEASKELESIEEQNENRKPSEHVSTTVCSTEMETSNVHIEEIEYQQFNPQKHQNQHKIRYSVQYVGDEHKYIIEEEAIESEEFQKSMMRQIQVQQRKSFIDKKNIEQTYEQFIEQPFSIENFIKKQQEFRNYLAFDRQFEKQCDDRKLSALKKVNLFETTQKKDAPTDDQVFTDSVPMEMNKNRVQTADVSIGTEIQDFVIKRQTQQLNETVSNMDLQKLRTNVKKKLLEVLKDEQKRWMVNNVDKENYHSLKKEQYKSANKSQIKFNVLEIDQTEPENQESNFTTPSKNIRQNLKVANLSNSQQKQCNSEKSQVSQSLLKKTFDKVASGVKTGVQFMADKVGLGNHVFRTNNKEIKSCGEEQKKQRKPKCEMKIWKQISERIEPQDKIYFISSTSQQVQVTSTIKKVRLIEEKLELVDQNKLEYPNFEEKEIEVVAFQVGTQTENIQTKHILEDAIMEVMHLEHKKKNTKRNKKGQKSENIHEDDQNKKQENKRNDKQKESMHETTSKCNSLKRDLGHSLKKRPEIVMSAKSAIAHKTRGARRKHDKH